MGRIEGGWGVRGHVKIAVLTDQPSRFSAGSTLFLSGRPYTVEEMREHKGRLQVKFESVDSRTDADVLRGMDVTIPRDQTEPLTEHTYYHFQVLDMEVWTVEGDRLGTVREILETPGNDVYVVRPAGSTRDLLLPALKDVVVKVSPIENRMVVRLPEGLA